MKKIARGLSLALATFGLFMSPVLAETGPPRAVPVLSTADQAFLTSLATPVAPTPAAKPPAGGTEALCTATAYCWDGSTRYCESNVSTTSCSATDSNCPFTQGGLPAAVLRSCALSARAPVGRTSALATGSAPSPAIPVIPSTPATGAAAGMTVNANGAPALFNALGQIRAKPDGRGEPPAPASFNLPALLG